MNDVHLPDLVRDLSTAMQGVWALVAVIGAVLAAVFALWRFVVPQLNIRASISSLNHGIQIGDNRAISVRAEVSSMLGSVHGCTVFVTAIEQWVP